jgi:hypothetical protein
LAEREKGVLANGFSLVVQHQRVLWWIFAVNFVLGGLGASSTAKAAGGALRHSLAGQKLADGFDLGMFAELVTQPDVRLLSHSGSVFIFACLYFLFFLFVTPGIVSVYLQDRRLSNGEFFSVAGEFFWSFVRLLLWSLIPFFIVDLLYQAVQGISDYVGDRAITDQTGFFILVIGCIPVLLLFVWVRLWFDLAQLRTVALNNRVTRHNAGRMFRIALRDARSAYWAYVAIGVLVWIITVVALVIWARVPARAVPITFLLLEVIMLAHIFGRLWQKACAASWYRLHPEPLPPVIEPLVPQPEVTAFTEERSDLPPDVDAPLSSEVEVAPEPLPDEGDRSKRLD